MAEMICDGARIQYEIKGEGDNVIVFVHGHPFDRSMWARQAEHFSGKGWRCVLFDLRGYGESLRTSEADYEFGQFSRDVEALMDHLRVGRAVLCGLSMGGQIVMDCCARMPERISGVVLAATAPQAETPESRMDRLAMADRLDAEGLGPYAEEVLPKMLSPESLTGLPDVAAYVLSMMRKADPAGAAAAQRARADRPAYEPVLSKLDAPALIVVGDRDAFTSRSDAELMNDLIKGSVLLWLEGAGHMPNLEREAEFNAAMVRLLERVLEQKGQKLCA